METFPCPKCGRPLAPSGEVSQDGHSSPVYQCDECLATVDIGGESFEVALTFVVNAEGRAFDPASPDGSLPTWDGPGPADGPA